MKGLVFVLKTVRTVYGNFNVWLSGTPSLQTMMFKSNVRKMTGSFSSGHSEADLRSTDAGRELISRQIWFSIYITLLFFLSHPIRYKQIQPPSESDCRELGQCISVRISSGPIRGSVQLFSVIWRVTESLSFNPVI